MKSVCDLVSSINCFKSLFVISPKKARRSLHVKNSEIEGNWRNWKLAIGEGEISLKLIQRPLKLSFERENNFWAHMGKLLQRLKLKFQKINVHSHKNFTPLAARVNLFRFCSNVTENIFLARGTDLRGGSTENMIFFHQE